MKTRHLLTTFALGLGLILALLWMLGGGTAPATAAPILSACPEHSRREAKGPTSRPLQAPGDVITVCLSGDCDYTSIQDAVDAANDGDVIKVAAGRYTDTVTRASPPGYPDAPASGVITQVVYVSKTVTIRGGYTTTNWTTPDPQANPTVLDAESGKRVIFVGPSTGLGQAITVTLENLRITGGDAAGLGGRPWDGGDDGGGVYVISATVTLSGNHIYSNTANKDGGGVLLYNSDGATLNGNHIYSNTANDGGGVELDYSDGVTLNGNHVYSNTAGRHGGGIILCCGYGAALNRNAIYSNTANDGGGVSARYHDGARLNSNHICSNTASDDGGGVSLYDSDDVTLDNNVIADNQAGGGGSGVHVEASTAHLRHNTLARSTGGDGSGVHVTDDSTIVLINTVLVSHTVGIYVDSNNTAMLTTTLWGDGAWANGTDWGGGGNIFTGTVNVWGDPAFVDPDAGDYHISLTSAAIDRGMDAGVNDDIDGDPRPQGSGYDLGADETGLVVIKQADPDPVQAGARLTYTIWVTNTGNVDLHATVTDTLPTHVTPAGALTWTPTIAAPGGVWTQTVIVTVEMSYAGPLTNVVQVTTEEGMTGVYTVTSIVEHAAAISIEVTPDPETVTAGESVTYHATAEDAYGNTWDVTAETTFSIEAGAGGSWADNVYTSEVVGTWTVTGDYLGLTDTATLIVEHAAAISIEVTPDPETVTAGESVTYHATAEDAYGNTWDVTAETTFSIEIGAGGSWTDNVYTSEVVGTWTVTGEYLGLHDTATLIVVHAAAISIEVTPDPETVTAGESVTYHATAEDAYGNTWDVTAETTFSIEIGAGGSWADNVYTSEVVGTWTVTGDYLDLDDTATLIVEHASAISIEVTPDPETVTAGESVTYHATAEDAYGNTWDVTAETTFSIEIGAGGSWADNVYTSEVVGTWTVTGDYLDLDDTATLTVTAQGPAPPSHRIYIPCVTNSRFPDLVVERIVATSNNVQVVIKNKGTAPVPPTTGFRVDLYVNPNPVPTSVNQTWDDGRSTEGIAWIVTEPALPLAPGSMITLTIGDVYYQPSLSNFPGALPAGTPIYAQVDSSNPDVIYGGTVIESHEMPEVMHASYNNITGPVLSTLNAVGE